MRVIVRLERLQIDVVLTVGVEFDSNIRRKIEVRIKSASAISTDDTRRSGEFPDVIVADAFTVDTGLDAITLTLDLRESEIDLGGDTCNIETPDI